jgi:hypothetical protein
VQLESQVQQALLDQDHHLMPYQRQHHQTQRLEGGQLEDHPNDNGDQKQ